MSNDYLAQIVVRLTYNGAVNLRETVENPCDLAPDNVHGRCRMYTGPGKYTSLAARAVERHLCALGLAEMAWDGSYWHDARQEDQRNMRCQITPLGREVAAYVASHWDELSTALQDSRKRGGRAND